MKIMREDLYTYAFSISYIIIFVPKFMYLNSADSEYGFIYQFIRNIVMPAIFFIILPIYGFNKLRKSELYNIIWLAFLSFFTAFLSKDFSIILNFLFLVFSRDVDLMKFFQILFYVFCALIFGYILNFIIDYYFLNDAISVFDGNFGQRYTFGLFHPNLFPIRFFIFVSLYLIIKRKITILDVGFIFFLNLFIYHYTYSRTSFYLVMLLLFLTFSQQYINLIGNQVIRYFSKTSAFIFFIVWYLLSSQYMNFHNELVGINNILSDRIDISFHSLNHFGVSFIPRDVIPYVQSMLATGYASFSIDVMYIYTLLSSGLIFVVLYSIFSFKLFKKLYKFNLYKEVIVLLSFVIYFNLERIILDISLNYSLMLLSFLLYKTNFNKYILSRNHLL